MTTSEYPSFLDESDKKRSEAKHIRDQGLLALVPCLRCFRASEICWVGANSKKCAYCTENITLCTVNPDSYCSADNAKAIVDGTQPPLRLSPEKESEKALRDEAKMLYAMNPSWHVKPLPSSRKAPARKLGPLRKRAALRKRAGKRIRDERRLALAPCLRCSRASAFCWVGIKAKNCAFCTEQGEKCTLESKDHTVVDEDHCIIPKKRTPCLGLKLQETRFVISRKVKQEAGEDEGEEEPEVTSDCEYQPDNFKSGSESPPRMTAERQSVEASEGSEEETPPDSSEVIAALRREIIEVRREMKEMRQEFRDGLQEISHVREHHQTPKIEIEIINLEDV